MKIVSALASAALALGLTAATDTPARAGDGYGYCAHFVFAGAYRSYGNAQRQANRWSGRIHDLDRSDSPNAGRGLFVVTLGDWSSRSRARSVAWNARNNGVEGAYAAYRCFYD